MSTLSGLEAAEKDRQKRERALTTICMRDHRKHWRVTAYKCNFSAFNGYHQTDSDYSEVICTEPTCRRKWRTKAAYVDEVPDY